ncbi:hypothetical protein [Alloactinosynnema sp. L-07]|nr:hypothetical protein [Alloactinosynnema sp. L-07]
MVTRPHSLRAAGLDHNRSDCHLHVKQPRAGGRDHDEHDEHRCGTRSGSPTVAE